MQMWRVVVDGCSCCSVWMSGTQQHLKLSNADVDVRHSLICVVLSGWVALSSISNSATLTLMSGILLSVLFTVCPAVHIDSTHLEFGMWVAVVDLMSATSAVVNKAQRSVVKANKITRVTAAKCINLSRQKREQEPLLISGQGCIYLMFTTV